MDDFKITTRLFHEKLGSKFLDLTWNFVHLSTKNFLIGFLFVECRIINVVANTATNMFLAI